MSYKVYLVEDEENLNEVLKSYMESQGWKVESFLKGKEAMTHIPDRPDLWVLDIMLPDIDGFEIIKEIKSFNRDTPVIFISARDAELDRVIGLEMGGDDYIAKPFLPRELIIRVKNLLKNTYETAGSNSSKSIIKLVGDYKIDISKRMAFDDETDLNLTSKEFDLLMLFIDNLNIAFSRKQILDRVWGDDYFGSDRVVDDLLRRLRKKVSKLRIESIYGYGYRMVD